MSFFLEIMRIREEEKKFFFKCDLWTDEGGVTWSGVLRSVSMRLFSVLEEVTVGET